MYSAKERVQQALEHKKHYERPPDLVAYIYPKIRVTCFDNPCPLRPRPNHVPGHSHAYPHK